jgi:cytosine/adenosine deaminase-related metal-dependent hydrolase
MFQAYTLNCAQAMRLDQQVGSLKVGALPCMFFRLAARVRESRRG